MLTKNRVCSVCHYHNPVLSPFITRHQPFNKSNMTDVTGGAGTTNPGRAERYRIDFFPVNYYLLLVDINI